MTAPVIWCCHTSGPEPVHVWPANDTIEHDHTRDDGECVCGPTIEPVEGANGYIGWLITHHSLDGREQGESA